MKELAPIVLFVYNRPEHTKKTIEALKENSLAIESELFIFSDFAKDEKSKANVEAVRDYLNLITGFKKVNIVLSEKNVGCDNSIINGVNQIIKIYSKVIVLEDDIVTSNNFLEFMNKCLDFYQNNKKIAGISGFVPPIKIPNNYEWDVFLYSRGSSWGWATWDDRWLNIDWEVSNYENFRNSSKIQAEFDRQGKDLSPMLINAMEKEVVPYWDIRRCFDMYNKKMSYIYPIKSKVQNIGNDGSGVHCGISNKNFVELDKNNFKFLLSNNLEEDNRISNNFRKHFNSKSFKNIASTILKYVGLYKIVKRIIK